MVGNGIKSPSKRNLYHAASTATNSRRKQLQSKPPTMKLSSTTTHNASSTSLSSKEKCKRQSNSSPTTMDPHTGNNNYALFFVITEKWIFWYVICLYIFTYILEWHISWQENRKQESRCQEISWFCQNWPKSVSSMKPASLRNSFTHRCTMYIYSIELTSINEFLMS